MLSCSGCGGMIKGNKVIPFISADNISEILEVAKIICAHFQPY